MRPGSGPKPDEPLQEARPVEMPGDMTASEQAIWAELAPKATQRGTLTPEMAPRFALLCKAVSMERAMAARILEDGLTYVSVTVDGSGQQHDVLKQHPLFGPHRGMMQRVEAGMVAFRLSPGGRAIVPTAPARQPSALEKLQARKLRAPLPFAGRRKPVKRTSQAGQVDDDAAS